MRVRILVSFSWAADFTTLGNNFTRPSVLETWLETLKGDPSARRSVLDLSTQLVFPDIIRDLALARLASFEENRRPEAIAQLERIIERLTRDENRLRIIDGGTWLRYAKGILGLVCSSPP